MTKPSWLNFYQSWELFWPRNITWGEMESSANVEQFCGHEVLRTVDAYYKPHKLQMCPWCLLNELTAVTLDRDYWKGIAEKSRQIL